MTRRSSWFVFVLAALFSLPLIAPGQAEEKGGDENAAEAKANAAAAAKEDEQRKKDEEYYELLELFVDTVDQVERNYVEPIDRRELMEAAIKGVLGKLDPYSSYINPDEIDRFRTNVENRFGGIGIQVTTEGGELKVISPLYGTPAFHAGVQAGDVIVEIEGESAKGITIDEAVKKLKGEPGSKVNITVEHPDGSRDNLDVTREIIRVETVVGHHRKDDASWDFFIDDENRIAYIALTAFGRDTTRDLRKAMEQVTEKDMQGLILDLRFNPGGLLRAAIDICDMFVSEGRIVSTKGRATREQVWKATSRGTYEDFPMVVLVNRYSASASEIVSACLQDHKRAVVIGERTWGKGSVQNIIELEGGRSALKLTTAGYMRPSGKNIHRTPGAKESDEWGVTPNEGFRMKLNREQMLALSEYRRNRSIIPRHEEQGAPEGEGEKNAGTEPAPEKSGSNKQSKNDQDAESPEESKKPDQPAKDDAAPEKDEAKPAAEDKKDEKQQDEKEEKKDDASGEDDTDAEPAKDAEAGPTADPDDPLHFVDPQLARALKYIRAQLTEKEEGAEPEPAEKPSTDENTPEKAASAR